MALGLGQPGAATECLVQHGQKEVLYSYYITIYFTWKTHEEINMTGPEINPSLSSGGRPSHGVSKLAYQAYTDRDKAHHALSIDQYLVLMEAGIFTSSVSGQGHRIGAVFLSVCLSALSRPSPLTYDLDFWYGS